MRKRGLERAGRLSWEECARRTLRVFDSLVGVPMRERDRRFEPSAG